MISLSFDGPDLVVSLHGLARLWAMATEIRVPLADIVRVRAYDGDPGVWSAGVRLGTAVPGVFLAGRCWSSKDGGSFWYLKRPRDAIYLERSHGALRRFVLDVGDPAAAIAAIERARGWPEVAPGTKAR